MCPLVRQTRGSTTCDRTRGLLTEPIKDGRQYKACKLCKALVLAERERTNSSEPHHKACRRQWVVHECALCSMLLRSSLTAKDMEACLSYEQPPHSSIKRVSPPRNHVREGGSDSAGTCQVHLLMYCAASSTPGVLQGKVPLNLLNLALVN